MVRLKVHAVHIINFTYRQFQFHYGTIKRCAQWEYPARQTYFNSTMVRLKDYLINPLLQVRQISIPLWYD